LRPRFHRCGAKNHRRREKRQDEKRKDQSASPDGQRQSGADFTRLLGLPCVILDTPHFNGMNTSLEAFSVGTPIVTLPGSLQRGRHTAAMYRSMGFTECIAASADDYARIAVRLATDPDYRRHAKDEIRRRSEALFEDARVVSEFERFFLEAARRRGREP